MFCHRCGRQLLGDDPEFCMHCGARVADRTAAPVSADNGTEQNRPGESGSPDPQPGSTAGYYPDPLDPSTRRFWTGSSWVAKPGDSAETASLLTAGPTDRPRRTPRSPRAGVRSMGVRPQDLDPMHAYRESSPQAVRRRTRRRITRWALVAVAGCGLLAITIGPSLIAAFDVKQQRAVAATASPSPTASGMHEVVYEIAGDGVVDWQWATSTGFDRESQAEASRFDPDSGGVPMSTSMTSGDLAQSVVSNVYGGRTVLCRIKIDGVVVVETQSEGRGTEARCEYRLP